MEPLCTIYTVWKKQTDVHLEKDKFILMMILKQTVPNWMKFQNELMHTRDTQTKSIDKETIVLIFTATNTTTTTKLTIPVSIEISTKYASMKVNK